MQPYAKDIKKENLLDAVNDMSRKREQDITDRNTFPAIFMLGRKVGKIPTSSADVAVTDRFGDFNYDQNYYYLCVNDSGAEWRRIALGSW